MKADVDPGRVSRDIAKTRALASTRPNRKRGGAVDLVPEWIGRFATALRRARAVYACVTMTAPCLEPAGIQPTPTMVAAFNATGSGGFGSESGARATDLLGQTLAAGAIGSSLG